jgi:hypothetical protein
MQWMLPFGLTMMIKLIAKRKKAEDAQPWCQIPFRAGEKMRGPEDSNFKNSFFLKDRPQNT